MQNHVRHVISGYRQLAALVAVMVSFGLLAGCSSTYSVKLDYRAIKPAAEKTKQISIGEVVNNREAKKGGKSASLIGTLRGGYGNPFPLNTKGKTDYTQFFKDLLNDAAKEVGYDVVMTGSAPRLVMDVDTFWCDGLAGYKILFSGTLKLLSADGNSVLASKTIEYGDGFVIVMSMREVASAYKKFFNRMLSEVEDALRSEEFARAL